MLPFFHPTSVLIVDDDPHFLDSMQFRFGDKFFCRTERSPQKALELARTSMLAFDHTANLFRVAHWTGGTEDLVPGDRVVQILSSRISAIAADVNRFAVLSVAIVDYDMPAMNGVEFFRGMRDLPTRKIMLTGKVGEETAVKAFNEGLIHRFLMKQDKDITTKLAESIQSQQNEFFAALTRGLQPFLATADTSFIADDAFFKRFEAICRDNGIVEYYVQTSPPGVLLIDEAGNTSLLVVYDQDSMRAQLETALHAGAPPDLIERLRTGQFLLVCPTATGFYEPELMDSWGRYLQPSEVVLGNQPWNLALLPPLDTARWGVNGLVPFATYKARLNQSRLSG